MKSFLQMDIGTFNPNQILSMTNFFSLPLELRRQIYGYVIWNSDIKYPFNPQRYGSIL